MKFKVGQKVRMVEDECDARIGDIGIVRALPNGIGEYAVEFPCFEETDRGHNCDGLVPSGNGHWVDEDQMELASEQEEPMTLKDHAIAYWDDPCETLEITPQDFPEITQVTIKDDSGTTTVRARVTKYDNGYTIEKLAEPKFAVGEQFVTASGKLGKVTKVNPEGNYCVQWFNGKYCSAQPEDTMRKIEWNK